MNLRPEDVAYITINPSGPFLASLQAGFANAGVMPRHLIQVGLRDRLRREWKRHRLSIVRHVLGPKLSSVLKAGSRARATEKLSTTPPPSLDVHKVNYLNSPATAKLLKKLGIRYLVNAGAGIMREPLLSAPEVTIVNAHAGRLPEYRNMNVVEWAIYNGDPVVGSVHRIESGIDTGHIWLRARLDLSGSMSVAAARERAFDQVARLVGPAVVAHSEGSIREEPQGEGGRSWYVMHPRLLSVVEEMLRKGVAEGEGAGFPGG